MKKIPFYISIMLLIALSAMGQQRAQFSQYMNNLYLINPATGGTDDYADLKVSYRSQWIGLPGAPTSYYVSGHVPIGKIAGRGRAVHYKKSYKSFGGFICNDRTGPTSRLNMVGSYAYNVKISKNFRVASGIFLGIQQYTLHGESLTYHDPGDNITLQRVIVPDLTVGVFGYTKQAYIGISMSQVFHNKLNFDYTSTGVDREKVGKLSNHYYIIGGVNVLISKDYSVVPSILIKYVSPAIPTVDISTKLLYKKLFWFGASYRSFNTFVGMAGITLNKIFVLSYSYDASVAGLTRYNWGSHELMLNIKFQGNRRHLYQKYFW